MGEEEDNPNTHQMGEEEDNPNTEDKRENWMLFWDHRNRLLQPAVEEQGVAQDESKN